MRSWLLGVLLAVSLLGPAHAAITFNFNWANRGYSATGIMTINKSAGQTFANSDISGTSITVSGPGKTPFTFTSWSSAGGTIAANGLSALFDAAGNPFVNLGGISGFGCFVDGCSNSEIAILFGGSFTLFFYSSPSDALSSMQLTAVPLPAALPMAAVAFGVLAGLSRRRRGTAGAGQA